jgi:hypothetical protein
MRSKHQDTLIEQCLASVTSAGDRKFDWHDLCRLGMPLWVTDDHKLLNLMETIGKQRFQATKDVHRVLLPYVACGKVVVLANMAKVCKHMGLCELLSNDFVKERWRSAAVKNAYALLRQKRYEEAVAFFLLPSPPRLEDAMRICVRKLNNPMLAILIGRIVECRNPAGGREQAPPHGIALGGTTTPFVGPLTSSFIVETAIPHLRETNGGKWVEAACGLLAHRWSTSQQKAATTNPAATTVLQPLAPLFRDGIASAAASSKAAQSSPSSTTFTGVHGRAKGQPRALPREDSKCEHGSETRKRLCCLLNRTFDDATLLMYLEHVQAAQKDAKTTTTPPPIVRCDLVASVRYTSTQALNCGASSIACELLGKALPLSATAMASLNEGHRSSSSSSDVRSLQVNTEEERTTDPSASTSSVFDDFAAAPSSAPAPSPAPTPAPKSAAFASSIFDDFDAPSLAPAPANTPGSGAFASSIFDNFDAPPTPAPAAAPAPVVAAKNHGGGNFASSIFDDFDTAVLPQRGKPAVTPPPELSRLGGESSNTAQSKLETTDERHGDGGIQEAGLLKHAKEILLHRFLSYLLARLPSPEWVGMFDFGLGFNFDRCYDDAKATLLHDAGKLGIDAAAILRDALLEIRRRRFLYLPILLKLTEEDTDGAGCGTDGLLPSSATVSAYILEASVKVISGLERALLVAPLCAAAQEQLLATVWCLELCAHMHAHGVFHCSPLAALLMEAAVRAGLALVFWMRRDYSALKITISSAAVASGSPGATMTPAVERARSVDHQKQQHREHEHEQEQAGSARGTASLLSPLQRSTSLLHPSLEKKADVATTVMLHCDHCGVHYDFTAAKQHKCRRPSGPSAALLDPGTWNSSMFVSLHEHRPCWSRPDKTQEGATVHDDSTGNPKSSMFCEDVLEHLCLQVCILFIYICIYL